MNVAWYVQHAQHYNRNTGDGPFSNSTLSFSSFVVRMHELRYQLLTNFITNFYNLPAQEGEDVLAGEPEEIRYVHPVEETQPPLQDLHQRQVHVGLGIWWYSWLLRYIHRYDWRIFTRLQDLVLQQNSTIVNDATLTRFMTRLQCLEEQLREIEVQLRKLQV